MNDRMIPAELNDLDLELVSSGSGKWGKGVVGYGVGVGYGGAFGWGHGWGKGWKGLWW